MPHSLDQAILQAIARGDAADQDTLLRRLARQGHELTQSTLSRHLKKLGIHKVEGVYRRTEAPRGGLPSFTLTVAPPNLIVLRTAPGFANALALRLDAAELPGLVGTIAGDDTVFIAVEPPAGLQPMASRVRTFLNGA
ncbi:MAG: arginine repressor [Acidobacteria bacterium]|nr:arginine repressor [Acidobacteriota bacterium]